MILKQSLHYDSYCRQSGLLSIICNLEQVSSDTDIFSLIATIPFAFLDIKAHSHGQKNAAFRYLKQTVLYASKYSNIVINEPIHTTARCVLRLGAHKKKVGHSSRFYSHMQINVYTHA